MTNTTEIDDPAADAAYYDPRDWHALVRAHRDFVYAHALRLTHSQADADDLTQEAFVRAFRAADRFEAGGSVRGWLRRIVTNLFLDTLRRRQRLRFEPLPAELDALTTASAETTALDGMLSPQLELALRELPEAMRDVVLLRYVGCRTDEQISERLGVEISTVRSRAHRAHRRMRAVLAP